MKINGLTTGNLVLSSFCLLIPLFRFGFSDECNHRLGEDPSDEDSVFLRVNRLFEWLPLATVIEDKIICLHGGIGSSLHYISEIENL